MSSEAITSARVESILHAQEMAGERLTNRIRFAYGILGLLMAMATARINTPEANAVFLAQGTSLVMLCLALFVVFRAFPDRYIPWLKFVTITFDIAVVHLAVMATVRNNSGVIEYFHSFFPLVLILWNLLAGLRYSVAACLYSAAVTALLSSVLLAWVVTNQLVPISPTSVWGENAINVADEAMRIVFVSLSGAVAAVLAHIARGLIRRAERESAERADLEKQKARLSKYLGGDLAEVLVNEGFDLAGERRTATIMFTDIRNFTSISQGIDPEETVRLLNTYFTEMVRVVFRYGGTLDKFLGDGLMAVYNAPFDRLHSPLRAVLTAVEMVQAVDRMNREQGFDPPLRMGAGISTGEVIAGNIGSDERMEYTVIGNPVNLAARLEGLNRDLGTMIVISEPTWLAVAPWISARPLPDNIKLKGISGDHRLYAIDPYSISPARLDELRAMVLGESPAARHVGHEPMPAFEGVQPQSA